MGRTKGAKSKKTTPKPEPAKPSKPVQVIKKQTKAPAKKPAPKMAKVKEAKPAEKGSKELASTDVLTFATEVELVNFAKDQGNIKRKFFGESHIVEDISDLSALRFDWNTRDFDPDHADTLYQSIRYRGILEPITIAVDLSSANPKLQVVRGRHRVEGMRTLRLKSGDGSIACTPAKKRLPARVLFYKSKTDYDKDKHQKWGDAASNIPELIKKDHVFARADYYSVIKSELANGSTGKVAKSLGLKRGTIRAALNLKDLPTGLQEAIEGGIKLLTERFIYKVASKYTRVEREHRRDIRRKLIKELGVKVEKRKVKKADGTITELDGAISPDQRAGFKDAFDKEFEKTQKELHKKQKLVEQELITWIQAEIKYRRDKKNNPKPIPPGKKAAPGTSPLFAAQKTKIKDTIAEIKDKLTRDNIERLFKEKGLI